jgi:hypothetical protein
LIPFIEQISKSYFFTSLTNRPHPSFIPAFLNRHVPTIPYGRNITNVINTNPNTRGQRGPNHWSKDWPVICIRPAPSTGFDDETHLHQLGETKQLYVCYIIFDNVKYIKEIKTMLARASPQEINVIAPHRGDPSHYNFLKTYKLAAIRHGLALLPTGSKSDCRVYPLRTDEVFHPLRLVR